MKIDSFEPKELKRVNSNLYATKVRLKKSLPLLKKIKYFFCNIFKN